MEPPDPETLANSHEPAVHSPAVQPPAVQPPAAQSRAAQSRAAKCQPLELEPLELAPAEAIQPKSTPPEPRQCDSMLCDSVLCDSVGLKQTIPQSFTSSPSHLWTATLGRISHDLIDLVLPPSCLCCHRSLDHSQSFLCAECLPTLGLIEHACLRCGAPLPKVVPETHGCLRCEGRSWSFKRAIAVGPYFGPLQKLVIAMKKLRHEATTLYFGRLLAARLQVTGTANEIDLIVPVPSHWWRRLIRKVSTAEVLAEAVANELHIPWTQQVVRRTRYTPKQGMLRAADRKNNVQGAFVAKLPSRWRNARILLIDDVLTSGSTANEVSRALLQAGAKDVIVGAIARALGDQRPNLV